MNVFFPAIIDQDTQTGAFGIVFPDFPGCVSAGRDLQTACAGGTEALQAHVDLMVLDGEDIPKPSEPNEVPVDPEVQEIARVMVPVRLVGKRRRYNVSLDEYLVEAIDAQVGERGRSGFLEQAARRALAEG